MERLDDLLRRAEAAERLARLVSYGPDKQALLAQAEALRRQAAASLPCEEGAPSHGEHPRRH